MIKTISCCGCYFDRILFIVKSNQPINRQIFETSYDWFFTDCSTGDVILMCENIFSEFSLTIANQLYKFELRK